MTTRDIIEQYLKKNGYDGLIETRSQCGCSLGGIFPCGHIQEYCEPAYKGPCNCGEGCDFDMYIEKPIKVG